MIEKLRAALLAGHPETGAYTNNAETDRKLYRSADEAAEAEINAENIVVVSDREIRINELDILAAFDTPQEGEAAPEAAGLSEAPLSSRPSRTLPTGPSSA